MLLFLYWHFYLNHIFHTLCFPYSFLNTHTYRNEKSQRTRSDAQEWKRARQHENYSNNNWLAEEVVKDARAEEEAATTVFFISGCFCCHVCMHTFCRPHSNIVDRCCCCCCNYCDACIYCCCCYRASWLIPPLLKCTTRSSNFRQLLFAKTNKIL